MPKSECGTLNSESSNGVASALAGEEARSLIDLPDDMVEPVIDRSRRLSAMDRIAIYANAYYTRLLECLADTFPAVRVTVGDDAFGGLAFGYLQAHLARFKVPKAIEFVEQVQDLTGSEV